MGSAPTGPIGGGRVLGELEEYFIEQLTSGDTFVFAGEVLCFEGMREEDVYVTRAQATTQCSVLCGRQVPALHLSRRPRAQDKLMARRVGVLPDRSASGCGFQQRRSSCRGPTKFWSRPSPAAHGYLVCYPFEGRLAHQTLGMLLTRRLERARRGRSVLSPTNIRSRCGALGDYAGVIAAAALLAELFDEDMLGDDLESWLPTPLMRRTFRCAIISGLIERRHPGKEKTGGR